MDILIIQDGYGYHQSTQDINNFFVVQYEFEDAPNLIFQNAFKESHIISRPFVITILYGF